MTAQPYVWVGASYLTYRHLATQIHSDGRLATLCGLVITPGDAVADSPASLCPHCYTLMIDLFKHGRARTIELLDTDHLQFVSDNISKTSDI